MDSVATVLALLERQAHLAQLAKAQEAAADPRVLLETEKKLADVAKEIDGLLVDDAVQLQVSRMLYNPSREDLLHSCHMKRQQCLSAAHQHASVSDLGSALSDDVLDRRSLDHLKRVSIPSLKLGLRSSGCFLLCKIFTPVSLAVGISFGVEDVHGGVAFAQVYNVLGAESMAQVDKVFYVGRIMGWKCPFYKLSSYGTNAFLRCDNPKNIVFVDDLSSAVLSNTPWLRAVPLCNDGDDWKELGNSWAKRGVWERAVYYYSRGLEVEPSHLFLLSNRSQGICLVFVFF